MKTREDRSTSCIISQNAVDHTRRAGLTDSSAGDPEDCTIIESMGKLLALGLSAEDIEELDIRQPMLQSICEYARLDETSVDGVEDAVQIVSATLKVIDDQIRDLDLELEMLSLRKRALERRTRVLEKLAGVVGSEDSLAA